MGPYLIVIELAPKKATWTKTLRRKAIRYYSQILIPAEIQRLSSSTVSRCDGIWLGSAVVPVMIPFAARWEGRPQ